ncbi:hypothetical protein NE852_12280 [Rhizobium sp. Pop5]|uniref:hypothetical protein n=1 Tax=Rhizobium sp. Pop5 TaxID=1223565 RepID=UPI000B109275|nr:hypothetical protein [Rhizobium sp. Pop5]UVD58906.1 hypothetical protein NE852_12280 [Rhizobium sp. Pop5]
MNIIKLFASVGVFILVFCAHASSAEINGIETSVLTGSCDTLIVGDENFTSSCAESLSITSYRSGRRGFYFYTTDERVFAFSGIHHATPLGSVYLTNIDILVSNLKPRADTASLSHANGYCTYEDFRSRHPVSIKCSGKTEDGRTFTGSFRSDGIPPD